MNWQDALRLLRHVERKLDQHKWKPGPGQTADQVHRAWYVTYTTLLLGIKTGARESDIYDFSFMENWGGPQFDTVIWESEGKTGKKREVRISKDTSKRLSRLWAWHPDYTGKAEAAEVEYPMKAYKRDRTATARTVRMYLARLAKELDINHPSFGVKTMRKTYAHHLYEMVKAQGADSGEAAMIVNKDLNHSSLQYTMLYLGLDPISRYASNIYEYI